MVKAIALMTVHVCKERGEKNDQGKVTKKAKIEVVAPGQIFEVEQADFEDLEKSGAARKATRADAAAADDSGKIPIDEAAPTEVSLEKPKR